MTFWNLATSQRIPESQPDLSPTLPGRNYWINKLHSYEMPLRKILTQGDAPSYRGRAFQVTTKKQIHTHEIEPVCHRQA
jgi:hypothetical protein